MLISMKRAIYMVLGFSLGLLGMAYGQDTTWNLQRLEDSVLSRNTDLRHFQALMEAQENQVEAARSWPAPQVGLGLSEFPYPGVGTKSAPDGPRKMPMIRVEQSFPNPSMNRASARIASSTEQELSDARITERYDVVQAVRQAFTDAGIALYQLNVVKSQEAQLEVVLNLIKGRMALHSSKPSAYYQAQAKQSQLHIMALRLTAQLDQNKAALNGLLERPSNAPLDLDTSYMLHVKLPDLRLRDTSSLLAHHSRLRMLQDEQLILKAQLHWQRAQAKPRLGLSWENMRMASGMYMFNAMAMVSLPFVPWHSREYQRKSDALQLQRQAVEDQLNHAQWMLQSRIQADLWSWTSAQQELNQFESNTLPAFRNTFEARLQELSEGTGSVFQTLVAWEDLTQQQLHVYDLWSQWLHADLDLDHDLQVSTN